MTIGGLACQVQDEGSSFIFWPRALYDEHYGGKDPRSNGHTPLTYQGTCLQQ